MDQTKKNKSTVLIMLLVFGISLIGNLFNVINTNADTVSDDSWKTPKMVILDGSGKEDITDKPDLSGFTSLKANFYWDIPDDATITDGETLNFQIPDNVQINFDKEGVDKVVKLTSGDNNDDVIGQAVVPYGTREGAVTLNDYFTLTAHNTNRKIELSFSGRGLNTSGENPGTDPGDKAFMVKTGWNNGSDGNNPTKLTWQTVLNQNNKTVSGLVVNDTIGDGQKFDPKSITIQDSKHNDIEGVNIDYTSNSFTLTFTKPITDKIDVLYNTDITTTFVPNDIYSWVNDVLSTYTGISDEVGGEPAAVPGGPIKNYTPTAIVNWGASGSGSGHNGSVVLNKVDAVTGDPLQGAVFNLVRSDGSTLNDASGNPKYQNLTTNSNGQIDIANLPVGKYKFVETKAPNNYLLNSSETDNEHEFEITASQQLPIEFNFPNHRDPSTISGTVTLNKIASDTGKALSGAKFDLQKSDGTTVAKGLSTDDDGQISYGNLPVGDYQFVETSAPDGYDINNSKLNFSIFEKQENPEVSMVDQKKTGTSVPDNTGKVVLTKSDSKTKSVLQGAVFRLENSDGKVLQNDLTTDSSGQITVDNLPAGKYRFVETKAPENYILNENPVSFDLKAGAIVNVSAVNDKEDAGTIPVDPTDPTDPTNPINPVAPTDPINPVDPTDPLNPESPNLPNNPNSSISQSESNNPVLPQGSSTNYRNDQAKLPQTNAIRSTFASVSGALILLMITLELLTKKHVFSEKVSQK
ncbi:outer membrane protein [Companilactobacillus tucceti DSM 20183]|uniref:Outer membrane protein n=1 Tax=Companilactobacillus tucceti DSM 20183 TaxID=1423811 RepID=A0A0R1IWY6_9LACO|nr:SpaA isopeptide-forming pilin-related protein [Companilactobacillus tucceti]KRK63757.1 outer membrane protein [Companilactobacillus tucceti DSM 20183]